MKKVIFRDEETILANEISEETPIFSRKCGKLVGMLIREDRGWILKFGDGTGSCGYHPTAEACMKESLQFGHEFFIEG